MFVKELTLREFRGVRETAKPLTLKKLNVLVGRNNSGKTAVLEALALLPHPYEFMPWFGERLAFVYKLHGEARKVLIYKYVGEAEISYMLEFGDVKLRTSITDTEISVYLADEKVACGVDGLRVRLREAIPSFPTEWENIVIFVPSSDIFLSKLEGELYSKRDLVVKTGAHYTVVRDVVNKCVDEVFTEILFSDNELRLRKEPSGAPPYYVRLKDQGDGLKRVISVLLWLEAIKPVLVLWDDFESNMHPSLIRAVLAWLADRDWQVVLATHSIDVLHALPDAWPREESQLILLHRTADDVLKADYMDVDELTRVLDETSQDPRYLVEWLKL